MSEYRIGTSNGGYEVLEMTPEGSRCIARCYYYNEADRIATALRRTAPEGEHTAWIPVEERLPDVDGWCDVWVVDDRHVRAAEFWSEDKQFWPPNGKGEHWAEQVFGVTHWMEMKLPDKPSPQQEGKS